MDELDSSRRSLLKAAGVGVLPFPVVGELQADLQVTVRQVNRPEFPEIELFATVRGPDGDPISGLTASEMAIVEDDADQTIDELTQPDDDERAGVSVSLVIDTSGSMAGAKLADAKQAARQFLTQLNFDDGDEAQVVAFDSDVTVVERWANEAGPLQSAIDGLTAVGGTAVWDATIEAVDQTAPRIGRSVAIVLTDGNDRSSSTVGQAVDAATTDGVPVYTIGLGGGSGFSLDEAPLKNLATKTGGDYYRAPDSDDLAAIYQRIQQSITGEYRVVYTTNNTATDGTTRTVELAVEQSGATGSDTGTYQAPCAPIPTAAFDSEPASPEAGEEIQFDAAPSDPNGGSLSAYEWDFQNDGTVDETGQMASFTYSKDGSYDVRLTVQKACGVTDVTVGTIDVGEAAASEGERTLMITGNAPTEYTLTVDGTLETDTYGGSFRAEDSDEPTENPDGTMAISDETGPVPDRASGTNYLGDRFLFTGSVVELDVPTGSGPPDVNLYLDEEDVPREEILDFEDASGETHTLMITGNAPTEYTLTVDGTLEADTYGGDFAAEDNDTPTENSDGTLTRSDETGPVPDRAAATNYLGDRFIVNGRVTELDLPAGDSSPDVNVYLDEELVAPDDVVADGST